MIVNMASKLNFELSEVHLCKHPIALPIPLAPPFMEQGKLADHLANREKRVSMWSPDAWGYGIGKTSLHKPHPWVLVVLLNREALGILVGATQCYEVDFPKESIFCFDADLDL